MERGQKGVGERNPGDTAVVGGGEVDGRRRQRGGGGAGGCGRDGGGGVRGIEGVEGEGDALLDKVRRLRHESLADPSVPQ